VTFGSQETPNPAQESPRFIADAMLGRLARWLRVLGYDTAYQAHIADTDLAQQAIQEQRILLTRDRALLRAWRLENVCLVQDTMPLVQLRQVVRQFELPWNEGLFSRCMLCNNPLEPVSRQDVSNCVPLYVLQHQRCFVRCPTCGRIYWEGSHVARMCQQLQHVLGSDVRQADDAEDREQT
jgi:uncharacterized protein with PIN domain